MEGTGHRSGGKKKKRVFTKCEEGELTWRIKNETAAEFPFMLHKVRDIAYLHAVRRTIE